MTVQVEGPPFLRACARWLRSYVRRTRSADCPSWRAPLRHGDVKHLRDVAREHEREALRRERAG